MERSNTSLNGRTVVIEELITDPIVVEKELNSADTFDRVDREETLVVTPDQKVPLVPNMKETENPANS